MACVPQTAYSTGVRVQPRINVTDQIVVHTNINFR